MLPKGGCKITDQILLKMDYNEYLCHGNFRMLIWLLKFLVHWSPKDLMLTLNETSPSILESAFFVVFFQIWHCIKWEVNMWCHNDQRRFWIEKKILRSNLYLWLYWNLLDEKKMKLIQFTFYFSGYLGHLWDACSWCFPLKEDTS